MVGTPTWAADLLAAFRAGLLSADELWCVVLDCHGLSDPAPVVGLVLRSHAALSVVPHPPLVELTNEVELFVLDETSEGLSISA